MKQRKIGVIWIGVYKGVNDVFISVNGSLSYTKWYPGEPNNYNGREDCVELIDPTLRNRYSVEYGQWNDVACWSSGRHYVCERSTLNTEYNGEFHVHQEHE